MRRIPWGEGGESLISIDRIDPVGIDLHGRKLERSFIVRPIVRALLLIFTSCRFDAPRRMRDAFGNARAFSQPQSRFILRPRDYVGVANGHFVLGFIRFCIFDKTRRCRCIPSGSREPRTLTFYSLSARRADTARLMAADHFRRRRSVHPTILLVMSRSGLVPVDRNRESTTTRGIENALKRINQFHVRPILLSLLICY